MKLVILHENIESETILIESIKNDCLIKKQSENKNIIDLFNVYNNYSHLTLIYNFNKNNRIPFYETTYTQYKYFSDDLIKLIEILRGYNENIIVDILTCNLNKLSFIEEVRLIESLLNINIRYSLDQTGNNPNGNWILESDNVDIKDLYFTNLIDTWHNQLDGASIYKKRLEKYNIDISNIIINNGTLYTDQLISFNNYDRQNEYEIRESILNVLKENNPELLNFTISSDKLGISNMNNIKVLYANNENIVLNENTLICFDNEKYITFDNYKIIKDYESYKINEIIINEGQSYNINNYKLKFIGGVYIINR